MSPIGKIFIMIDIFYLIILRYAAHIGNKFFDGDVDLMWEKADKTFISIIIYTTFVVVFIQPFYFLLAFILTRHL